MNSGYTFSLLKHDTVHGLPSGSDPLRCLMIAVVLELKTPLGSARHRSARLGNAVVPTLQKLKVVQIRLCKKFVVEGSRFRSVR